MMFLRVTQFCSYIVVLLFQASGVATVTETNDRHLPEISSRLRERLETHLNQNRHHDVNGINKDNVRNYITETLRSYDLDVQFNHFSGIYDSYDGLNIVGVLPGQRIGTTDDKVVLLGAHYDTTNSTPGVDDNGSGVAVMLEAAAMVTQGSCAPLNTMLFAAFDLEEYQILDEFDNGDICIGSYHFVNDWLEPFLKINTTTRSQFQGALVMETVLNYNKIDNSQQFPEELVAAFPEIGQRLTSRNLRGDFLTVIGRQTDAAFAGKFASHLAEIDAEDMYTEVFVLPIEGVPTELEQWIYGEFFRSDHVRFWEKGPPYLPALFITDTANFRLPMTDCYHNACDNNGMITNDHLLFLARTTKAAVSTLVDLGMENMTDCSVGAASVIHPHGPLSIAMIAAIIGVFCDLIISTR